MKTKLAARLLRIEYLEHRAVMDGRLSVNVLGGVLFITGDDKSNGATISPPSNGGGGAPPSGEFLLTPDASTAINNGSPGVSFKVSGVTAGARISLQAGDDWRQEVAHHVVSSEKQQAVHDKQANCE